ncbi:propionyl-CoA synthetase [Actinobacteria bacterium YIM 96077]|uniref:Propionyl-CoA synthetase n=1 Tax=Phytoactinopolyspora halophila TaxID=1981511 RepID=A0A329QUT9_9ACTN|nr:propionyl-CoA synthetase [Actinobacteria bacterium YIM 96077]RAW15359.1 propionyl-CoA synthetase [Phytoactinopolyspora halophila]
MGRYAELYHQSLTDPESFWLTAARSVDWVDFPSRALDSSEAPLYRWFPDGVLNTCHNALDRHVNAGRGEQVALIYDSPVTGRMERYTYRDLLARVERCAGALAKLGVSYGDRVVIYMPMIPQTVVAMLACARLGAVHSVVFGGFAARELASRIDDARPAVIVAASCGIEPTRVVEYGPILEQALSITEHQPDRLVMFQREQAPAKLGERTVDWNDAVDAAEPVSCVPVAATDPLYVLYTSGTTGKPKGVVRDNGGHAVAMAWSLANVYNIAPGEVFFTASDVGWVVGHSYIVYAPLIAGATTVLYEGKPVGTPDAGAFWRVISDHGAKALFTAPTAFRAIRKADPHGELLGHYDLSTFETLFLAGERLDPETYHWAGTTLGVPVVDHWWQTETGWPICANLRGLEPMPIKPGSPSVPVPGYDVRILDPTGNPLPAGGEGDIAIKLPLPPGTLPTLWGDDQRFIESYLSRHDGYYVTGDGGYIDGDGYLYVMGRTDDVINVAGHRLSTGSIEAVLAAHPAVAECAVIGVQDPLKGQLPRGFVVLKSGIDIDHDDLCDELATAVRTEIGAIAAVRDISVVDGLPKTRSGKILRKTMRAIADEGDAPVPSTIEDPGVLDALRPILRA